MSIKFPTGVGVLIDNGPNLNFNTDKKPFCTFDLLFITDPSKLDKKDEFGNSPDLEEENILLTLNCAIVSESQNVFRAMVNSNSKYFKSPEEITDYIKDYVGLIVQTINETCEISNLESDVTIDKIPEEVKEAFDSGSEEDYLEYFIFKNQGKIYYSSRKKKLISTTERFIFDLHPAVKEFYKVTKHRIKIPAGVPFLKAKGENNFLIDTLTNDDTYSFVEIETNKNLEKITKKNSDEKE